MSGNAIYDGSLVPLLVGKSGVSGGMLVFTPTGWKLEFVSPQSCDIPSILDFLNNNKFVFRKVSPYSKLTLSEKQHRLGGQGYGLIHTGPN